MKERGNIISPQEAVEVINGLFETNGFDDVRAKLNYSGDKPSGVHIKNSFRIRSKELRAEVCAVLERIEGVERRASSFCAEWAGHNAVFRVIRSRPEIGDADLEFSGDPRAVIRFLTRALELLGVR